MTDDVRYRSRKFILASVAFAAALGLFVAGYLTSTEWLDFTRWVVGLYLGANIADSAVTARAA